MKNIACQLINDEQGFIVSAELVLIATIAVLGMVVGLSEVALNINHELEDVGSAFGSISQSFRVHGLCGHQGNTSGSSYQDTKDYCDNSSIVCNNDQTGEQ